MRQNEIKATDRSSVYRQHRSVAGKHSSGTYIKIINLHPTHLQSESWSNVKETKSDETGLIHKNAGFTFNWKDLVDWCLI